MGQEKQIKLHMWDIKDGPFETTKVLKEER
jgi:hypothetical protein